VTSIDNPKPAWQEGLIRRPFRPACHMVHWRATIITACTAGSAVFLAASTQSDWELRIGAKGGRLHGCFLQPTCSLDTRESCHGLARWACETCKRSKGYRRTESEASAKPIGKAAKADDRRKLTPKPSAPRVAQAAVAGLLILSAFAVLVSSTAPPAEAPVLCRKHGRQPPRPDRQSVANLPEYLFQERRPSDELANALAKAQARALDAQQAYPVQADRDDGGSAPVGRARPSIFDSFVMPDLRGRVAAKVTATAKPARADKNSIYLGSGKAGEAEALLGLPALIEE